MRSKSDGAGKNAPPQSVSPYGSPPGVIKQLYRLRMIQAAQLQGYGGCSFTSFARSSELLGLKSSAFVDEQEKPVRWTHESPPLFAKPFSAHHSCESSMAAGLGDSVLPYRQS